MSKFEIVDGCAINAISAIEKTKFEEGMRCVQSILSEIGDEEQTYLIAMETTVPRNVVLDAVAVWNDRIPYHKPAGASALPYGYWSDLLVFPVREKDGKIEYLLNKKYILCASVPTVTVERKILGIIGEKHTIINRNMMNDIADSVRKMVNELHQTTNYAYDELDEAHYYFVYEAICRARAEQQEASMQQAEQENQTVSMDPTAQQCAWK